MAQCEGGCESRWTHGQRRTWPEVLLSRLSLEIHPTLSTTCLPAYR
jgi:hypothetical protein